ncbi:MAG: hypothetical protein FGM52_10445 [Mycobacterium sp.]|nr:hypothetical protein [Mycobacterium sp.]
MPRSRYAELSHSELVVVVRELLLIGQLIDRSGMAWCIASFGREVMLQIAIEEWAGCSPLYTKRMQKALNYEGDDVVTIFKGLQFDIGAPPQFMDFRFTVHDRWHGEFHLDHCGALLDVEPMGPDYVTGMCHDIEDPTFDATAVATNPRAQVRPIHRPPRHPADRRPHCAWTVIIDPSYPPAQPIPALATIARTRAAAWPLAPIDPAGQGAADYSGPLLADVDFGVFSHSALVRIADEVCLQMHLLNLSFVLAVTRRTGDDAELANSICTKQLVGIAGLAAERLRRALGLGSDAASLAAVLRVHPLINPAGYVDAEAEADADADADVATGRLTVRRSPAHDDGTWIALCGPGSTRPLQAIATAVDPHLRVTVTGTDTDWIADFHSTDAVAEDFPEVQVAKVSRGATFQFQPRRSLPLTVQ